MTAPQIIIDLVESFKKNEHIYKDSNLFDEENTKTDFINPFFEALGWDVTNKKHRSPQFKDVVYEKSIKVGTKTKAPDYEFRVGGTPIFFVEAKKPSVNIETDKNPAFQIRRYGWSAKLKLCILTDFEELAVYETNIKPDKKQSASIGRVKYYHYSEYVEKWDEIASIFSKEAVLNGDFDNFAEANSDKKKKGTGEVDDEFLKEMEHWRDLLARNIALRNKDLNEDALNYAVQITIDRILFCRMAEDRGIEKYGTLLELTKKDNIYQHLMEVFKIADLKYNSGLFCLSADPARHINRDMVTEHLIIDDGVFKEIFTNLYYPNCPYEFSVISPEILGKVYEQMLGSIIRLTDSHRAKVEVKPEVKKAGGVFYTPQYIVKEIVSTTVGKLISGKTPSQISKFKILDPACGSGSFLIVAYQELLNYHLDYYTKLEKPPQDVIYQGKDGEWRLTIREKKRILKNNIYGVDLDFLAVEVTKLSLLLKVLEDQNKDVVEQQQKLFHERVLPDLSDNIKNGNSLISSDILNENLTSEEIMIINPFDWEDEFKEVFVNGGFDIIIENPPYIRIQTLNQNQKALKYYKDNYESAVGSYDTYNLFVEKSLNLINKEGEIGFILPNKFFLADYGKGLRKIISDKKALKKIINFKDNQIFDNASTYTCLLFLKENSENFKYAEIEELVHNERSFDIIKNNEEYDDGNISVGILNSSLYSSEDWRFFIGKSSNLIKKLMSSSLKLNDFTEKIYQGLATSADKIFIVEKIEDNGNLVKVYSKQTDQNHILEKEMLKPYIKGKEIKNYKFNYQNKLLLFPYNINDDSFELKSPKEIKNNYPQTWEYLKLNEKILRAREKGKMNDRNKWYAFTYPKSMIDYQLPKIMTPNSAFNASFNYDSLGQYYITAGVAGGYAIKLKDNCELNEYYLLSILNSSLMDFVNHKIGTSLRGKYYSYTGKVIENYPIIKISLEDQMPFIELSEKLVNLNLELDNFKNPKQRKLIMNQIKITEDKINQLVYELYGLTDEEIKIIEENI